MTQQEKTKWLRAILQGEVKPGDAAWERIRTEKEFADVRRAVKGAGHLDIREMEKDLDEVWHSIEIRRNKCLRTMRRRWAFAASVLLLVGIGGALLRYVQGERGTGQQVAVLSENTDNQVMLVTAGGERLVLSDLEADTVFTRGEVKMHVAAQGNLSYEHSGEGKTANQEYNRLIVPRKCEYQIMLADGTKVYLNAETELRYPAAFGGSERRVFLNGEAYFEVARDTSCPFYVETSCQTVCVLGTSFNINAYSEESRNYTTLVSGKVEVSGKQSGNGMILQPGQQTVLDMASGKMEVRKVDVRQVTAWREGLFVFDGLSLEQIMAKLSRWYDVQVFYKNPEARNYIFKGNIPRYNSLEEVLNTLGKVSNLHFDLQGETVTVDLNKTRGI